MAQIVYRRFVAELMRKTLDGSLHGSNRFKAYAIANTATVTTSQQYLSDLAGGATVGSAVTLTGATVSNTGELDFANFIFSNHTGATCKGVMITYNHTALGQELLVYYDDTMSNWTPVGTNVNINLSSTYLIRPNT